jgi:HK97 family phage major capsid protein
MLNVILRATGKLEQIPEADFDEKLHIRVQIEEQTEDIGTVTELRAEFQTAINAVGTKLDEVIEGLSAPTRSRVTVEHEQEGGGSRDESRYDDRTRMAFGTAGRTRAAAEAQYDRLPEVERKYRTYEGDIMCVEWLRALVDRNHQRLDQIRQSPAFWSGERADHSTTATEGGELVPAPLANFISQKRDAFERVAPNAMSVTSEATTLDIPQEGATIGAVNPVAEGIALSDTDSVFASLTLTKKKAGRLAYISWELLNDQSAAFSIINILSQQAARKLAVAWDGAAAGVAGHENLGVADGAELNNSGVTAGITWATAGTATGAEVNKLIVQIPSAWRATGGVVAMGNSNVTSSVSQLVDANGRPTYANANDAFGPLSDVGNATGILAGVPYLEVPYATDILVVGNLRDAFAVLRDGMLRIDTSSDFRFASDQIALRVLERRAAGTLQDEAFAASDAITTPAP